MNHYEQMKTYTEALAFKLLPTPERPNGGLADDRGLTMEQIVIIGGAALGAAAVSLVLWQTLKSGADSVNVPAPQAP